MMGTFFFIYAPLTQAHVFHERKYGEKQGLDLLLFSYANAVCHQTSLCFWALATTRPGTQYPHVT